VNKKSTNVPTNLTYYIKSAIYYSGLVGRPNTTYHSKAKRYSKVFQKKNEIPNVKCGEAGEMIASEREI